MRRTILGTTLAGLTMAVSLGGAAATTTTATQQYYAGPGIYCFGPNSCYPIAFQREVYSDAELTNLIGSGYDSCVGGHGDMVWITTPQLPTGYEVATPMYVCTPGGPYLPMDW